MNVAPAAHISPQLLRTAAEKALARKSLIPFAQRMYPNYTAGYIHYRIGLFLERAAETPNFRGVLIVPPRFGKSELASIQLPAWYLGRHPDREIIGASHTQSLSNHFSRRARRNVQARAVYPFSEVTVAVDASAIEQWEVEAPGYRKRGRYQAIGVGGSPAGRGADLLLVDDPVKNAQAAESAIERDSTWEWFVRDIMTRLQPGASAVVIGTRWHWNDLIGRIIQQTKDGEANWEVLHFPALLPDGTSLDPARWPLDQLMQRRRDVGERTWEALYQGNPTPDEGAILKKNWFPLYDTLPPGILYTIQSWDTAYKTNKRNDFSVCHTYAITVYGLFLIGRLKARLEFPELERAAIEQFEAFKPRQVLIEDKVSGTSLGQSLRRKTRIPVKMVPVGNDESKIQRVHDMTPHYEAQRVHLPMWAPYLEELLHELTAFPLGLHDDEVDAMTQAVMYEFGNKGAGTGGSVSYAGEDEADDFPRGARWQTN